MTTHPLTVLAVDDEPPALDDLARILRANSRVADVETATSAQEAILKASARSYDAIFLDVRMPQLDGLELGRVLKAFAHPPALVFVSAFDTSAVATFELRALDFLMKPVTSQRLDEALARVNASIASGDEAAPSPAQGEVPEPGGHDEVIAVHNVRERSVRLLTRSSILYVMAYGDYLRVFADSGRYLTRGTLLDIERRFEAHGFMRVHRQYLANLRRMVEIQPRLNGTALLVFDNGGKVPVARRHVSALRRRLRP